MYLSTTATLGTGRKWPRGKEGKIGKIGKKEMKGKATLTSSTVGLTVRESKEPLMLLYRYDVDLVFYCLNIAFLQKYCYFAVYKQFICER